MKKIFVSLFLLAGIALSLNAQTIVTSDQQAAKALPKWRIAVQGGGGYRMGKLPIGISNDMREYMNGLKWGYSYGADITYFFGPTLGVGVKYHDFHTSNQAQGTFTFDNGSSKSGTMADKIDIWFLGPILSYRVLDSNARNAFYMSAGAGYVGFYNNATLVDPLKMTGGTIGMTCEIGFDFGLSDHLSLGFAASCFTGGLTSCTRTFQGETIDIHLDNNNRESMVHADLTVGLRYNF